MLISVIIKMHSPSTISATEKISLSITLCEDDYRNCGHHSSLLLNIPTHLCNINTVIINNRDSKIRKIIHKNENECTKSLLDGYAVYSTKSFN